MKKIITGLLAISIAASAAAASAQPRNDRDNNRDRDRDRRNVQRDYNGPERWNAPKRFKADRYKAPRGYSARRWGRGERLPQAYRGRNYVVDHRRYGLAAPPRGYEYVRVDNDVILTAVATGVIASVVAGLFN